MPSNCDLALATLRTLSKASRSKGARTSDARIEAPRGADQVPRRRQPSFEVACLLGPISLRRRKREKERQNARRAKWARPETGALKTKRVIAQKKRVEIRGFVEKDETRKPGNHILVSWLCVSGIYAFHRAWVCARVSVCLRGCTCVSVHVCVCVCLCVCAFGRQQSKKIYDFARSEVQQCAAGNSDDSGRSFGHSAISHSATRRRYVCRLKP